MIERRTMSISQFADLCAFEPAQFIGVEVNRQTSTVTVLLEVDEIVACPLEICCGHPVRDNGDGSVSCIASGERWRPNMQTTGTCPPLSDNTKRRPPKKGKR